jgi:site-specific DNA-methyltransferase (adenine-specific)
MRAFRRRKGRSVHFRSESVQWYTPPAIVAEYAAVLGPFVWDLDPCADPRAPSWGMFDAHFTVDDDGLAQPWFGRCWVNPPYGREIAGWVRKAADEVEAGHAALVALLVPARSDTAWWHDAVARGAEVHLRRGRIRFLRPDGSTGPGAAFPSAVLVFRNGACVTKRADSGAP